MLFNGPQVIFKNNLFAILDLRYDNMMIMMIFMIIWWQNDDTLMQKVMDRFEAVHGVFGRYVHHIYDCDDGDDDDRDNNMTSVMNP